MGLPTPIPRPQPIPKPVITWPTRNTNGLRSCSCICCGGSCCGGSCCGGDIARSGSAAIAHRPRTCSSFESSKYSFRLLFAATDTRTRVGCYVVPDQHQLKRRPSFRRLQMLSLGPSILAENSSIESRSHRVVQQTRMHLLSLSRGEGVWTVGLAVLLLLQAHIAMAGLVGGKSDVPNVANDLEMDELAKFAVSEHNNRENGVAGLSFSKLLKAQKQVVAGMLYHLTIEVVKGGEAEVWEAKVWSKPWEKFKTLQDFKFLRKASADGETVGHDECPADGNRERLRQVPIDDPVVQEAAEHALKGLQQRSNSLVPYELQDVVSAHAGVCNDSTNLELVLKVKRSHEEHIKAELHRTGDGVWSVKHFTQL